jgi:serine/threonine-protein kinase HipA
MRKANVYQQGALAGILEELDQTHYRFAYSPDYGGEPISLTLPVRDVAYDFDKFPAVFEGLLPEGAALEALLRQEKVDRSDMFQQLIIVGEDVVGSLTVAKME